MGSTWDELDDFYSASQDYLVATHHDLAHDLWRAVGQGQTADAISILDELGYDVDGLADVRMRYVPDDILGEFPVVEVLALGSNAAGRRARRAGNAAGKRGRRRPPRGWWRRCVGGVEAGGSADPRLGGAPAVCGATWARKPEAERRRIAVAEGQPAVVRVAGKTRTRKRNRAEGEAGPDACETMQTRTWVDRTERRAGTELERRSLTAAQRGAVQRIGDSAHEALENFYVPREARTACFGRIRPEAGGGDRAGARGSRVTGTNLYVLREVADAVELYGAPIRRFAPTSTPHLRRLISFGLLERVPPSVGDDPRAPGWVPSAAGYAALEEDAARHPRLHVTGVRDPDPEQRERAVRMLRQEMQP